MRLPLLRDAAAAGVAAAILTCTTSALAAVAPAKTPCPSAAMVGAVLGIHLNAQPSKTTSFAKQCLYKTGTSPVSMTIEFQEDTAQTFASGENAVMKTIRENVPGLGKAAYGTKVGGFLAVFLGSESIRITAPGATLGQLETLARDLAHKLG